MASVRDEGAQRLLELPFQRLAVLLGEPAEHELLRRSSSIASLGILSSSTSSSAGDSPRPYPPARSE